MQILAADIKAIKIILKEARIHMNNTTANMPLKDSLKPSPLALLPIGVFLVIYAGSGIIFHDFYNMPAIIAFLAALKNQSNFILKITSLERLVFCFLKRLELSKQSV